VHPRESPEKPIAISRKNCYQKSAGKSTRSSMDRTLGKKSMSSSNPTSNKIISIGSVPQTVFKDIIGQSAAMKAIFRMVEKVAGSDTTIMLNGETGTGKGVIARAIHECSPRRSKPLIQINCGATPEGLLESEFFGYRRGAFTGAVADKPGKFEMANGGTIFLDEIGDMSADLQVKVLRVLEEGEFERVGGRETIKVDARIIAATHRDLEEEVQKGHFREDLFYRLYVIPIMLPALRERKSDIPFLVHHFLDEFARKNQKTLMSVAPEAMHLLMNYPWYGNVRELKNMIERIVVLRDGDSLRAEDLPEKVRLGETPAGRRGSASGGEEGISFQTAVSEFEKALILSALEKTNWVKNRAADLLQIKRTTLVEKIKRYQLEKPAGDI
jgi:transcriptional regulator with GAF, ATPase, and Fis domain